MVSKPIMERIKELKAEGISQEELISRIMAERYNVKDIVRGLKISVREIGRIKRGGRGEAAKVIRQKVEDEVTTEALDKVATVLSTGKSILDELAPIAQHQGFERADDFVLMCYRFWDLYHDQVEAMKDEIARLKAALAIALTVSRPDFEKHVKLLALKEFLQTALLARAQGLEVPREAIQEYYDYVSKIGVEAEK